mgnify:CR=1 FL=1
MRYGKLFRNHEPNAHHSAETHSHEGPHIHDFCLLWQNRCEERSPLKQGLKVPGRSLHVSIDADDLTKVKIKIYLT